jgi:hypothetical protein
MLRRPRMTSSNSMLFVSFASRGVGPAYIGGAWLPTTP